MLPITIMAMMHSLTPLRGLLVGPDARPYLLNRRWRTVPPPESSDTPYEWELQSRTLAPNSPFVLRIFKEDGVESRRNARCPLFLPNYISLDSIDSPDTNDIFKSNTIYYLDATKCVLQNTWFARTPNPEIYGPYFLSNGIPLVSNAVPQEPERYSCYKP
jgi:hypothetical protein